MTFDWEEIMNNEKSCGVIVYRYFNKELEFLAIKSKENNHWGFPKGHMEKDENEEETAKREVFEETGLKVILQDGFKAKVEYFLDENRIKEVVFFIGTTPFKDIVIQQDEIQDFIWINYADMLNILTFENIKKVLMKAYTFLIEFKLA